MTDAAGGAAAAGWVYSFNVGVEAEAAGREPPKSFVALRRDLAVLPWVLAGPGDIVLAPPPRPRRFASTFSSPDAPDPPDPDPPASVASIASEVSEADWFPYEPVRDVNAVP